MDDLFLNELREQTKWLKLLVLPGMRKTIKENITTREQKRIYTLSDGKNSTNDIAKKMTEDGMKVSHMTVYNYWKRWFALGIVIPSHYPGRFEKIIELSDLGIQ